MAFARTTAVAGAGTLTCAGTTTVTIAGSSFAFGIGGAPSTSTVRVGSTITVGGNTRTVISIQSTSSLTVDTAFPVFATQSYTVSTGIIQTGTDTLNLSLGAATGIIITNRGDLFRTFDVQGLDLFIEGTLTVDSRVAQLRNDGSCSNRFEVLGSATGGEIIVNGRKATAANAPFPYPGFDWLGQNGQKIMKLKSTNASFPAKFTIIDACIRYGADWLTTDSGNHSRITTQGDICWILCARGTGTSQARLRQDNTTAAIDFQATKTFVGVWLNFGVPQLSLKGYTPIDTDGPEINLASVPTASLITIDNYNTTHVLPSYYAGVQIVLLGSAWTRLKNNLLGTNIAWRSSSSSGGRHNVIEFSKQITSRVQDTAGNLLSDGFMYYQPTGSNVAGVRGKGMTTDITFDLSQQNIATVDGEATSEFRFAWGFTTATTNLNTYAYFCTGQTKGAETHSVGSSRYGYDKQYITVGLSGNNDVTPTYVHTSLPTSDKVIATASAISGIAFNFTTKVMTITGNLTYQQIYDAYQYALNQTANLFQADNCLTANSTSNYVGWTINVATGVTLSTGSGNFNTLKANTITLTGTAIINGIYQDSTGTSTILKLENISPDASVCVWNTSTGATEFFQVNNTATAQDYFIYYPPGNAGTTKNVARELYGIKRYDEVITLAGGEMWWTATDQEDVGITDTKTVASAYTTLSTTSQIYDATAIFRLTETGIKLGQLVARDGLYLDFGTYNVKIKDDASAIVGVASGTITYKSIVINETTKYNAMKATPPKTITPTDTEIINVLIEDANGDSQLSILGGDNLGYELWKVTTATATDDYATGTLLATLATNANPFRFIGLSGFDIVGRDVSSGVRRRSSMLKGSYEQAFYVGNQIQLATDAPQLLDTIDKLDELTLKVDTNLDVKVSTRLAAVDYVEPHNTEIDAIKAKTDTLENTDLTGIATGVNVLDAKTEILTAIDDIPTTDISLLALEATSQSIKTKVDGLENYNDTTTQTKLDAIQETVDNISVDFTPVLNAVDALPTLSEIEAGKVGAIKTKVDTLENTDLNGIATATNVTNAKDEIIAEIGNIDVDNVAIANEVWDQEPERLKKVATVDSTGEQLEALNS
jgi:hypothetical protein